MKILKRQTDKSNWEFLNENLHLINEHVNINNPNDASYVFSGFCPITIRLLESIIRKGWGPIRESLKRIPGGTLFPSSENEVFSPRLNKTNFILVVFIGGITYAELAAIRYLNKNNKWFKFIVLTTHFTSGKKIVENLRINFPQSMSIKDYYGQLKSIK